jgi:hypothetical protein
MDKIRLRLCPIRFSVVCPDGSAGFKQLPTQGFAKVVFGQTFQKPDQNERELFCLPFQLDFVH